MTFTGRIRCDARLREPEPRPQPKSKRGRKPRRGPYLPKLSRLARHWSKFATEAVSIYGKQVTLRLRELVAYWPAVGRVVKVAITRDPKRPKRTAHLVTTDLAMTAVGVVERFARRWTTEELFSAAKNQMGFDSAEVRAVGAEARGPDDGDGQLRRGVGSPVPVPSERQELLGEARLRPPGGGQGGGFRLGPPARGLRSNCGKDWGSLHDSHPRRVEPAKGQIKRLRL
jgi:hypothetical protein